MVASSVLYGERELLQSAYSLDVVNLSLHHSLVSNTRVDEHVGIDDVTVKGVKPPQLGNKECFVFQGDAFDNEPVYAQIKSILLDIFSGANTDSINLKGLDSVNVVSTAGQGTVYWRRYVIKYKKSGTKVPRVELHQMGPSFDLSVRRHKTPPPEMQKEVGKMDE